MKISLWIMFGLAVLSWPAITDWLVDEPGYTPQQIASMDALVVASTSDDWLSQLERGQ